VPLSAPRAPDPFLEVRLQADDLSPTLLGWCAGFEAGKWRDKQLAKHLLRWLPEFALRYGEWSNPQPHNIVDLVAKAAASIYTSKKYEKRGEFGEILLHAMIRQHFNSVPAISKYYYKDSANDTVKGFDAVHVVPSNDGWELWFGEVKFYNNIAGAITDVVEELQQHSDCDYLRGEFTAITNKLDSQHPQSAEIIELLHKNRSLDEIFKRVCIPVLLTYDSQLYTSHVGVTTPYKTAFATELRKHHATFASKNLPKNVTIRLLLLPLQSKARLAQLMDQALKSCQDAF
jgi:hypothetical protein